MPYPNPYDYPGDNEGELPPLGGPRQRRLVGPPPPPPPPDVRNELPYDASTTPKPVVSRPPWSEIPPGQNTQYPAFTRQQQLAEDIQKQLGEKVGKWRALGGILTSLAGQPGLGTDIMRPGLRGRYAQMGVAKAAADEERLNQQVQINDAYKQSMALHNRMEEETHRLNQQRQDRAEQDAAYRDIESRGGMELPASQPPPPQPLQQIPAGMTQQPPPPQPSGALSAGQQGPPPPERPGTVPMPPQMPPMPQPAIPLPQSAAPPIPGPPRFADHTGPVRTVAGKQYATQSPEQVEAAKRDADSHVITSDEAEALGDAMLAGKRYSKEAWTNAAKNLGPERTGKDNDFQQFYKAWLTDNEQPDNSANRLKARKLFQEAGQAPQRPPQALMIGPDGKAVVVGPGSTVPQGAVTPAGQNSMNVPTSQTRTMAEVAPKVTELANKVGALIDQQEKSLGPAASRWQEYMAGKVGAPNPEFTKLRTDVGLLQTLLMRMHVGARGGEQIMAHFVDLLDASKQSPANLRAALGEIKAYADEVAASGRPPGSAPSPSTGGAGKNDPLGIR